MSKSVSSNVRLLAQYQTVYVSFFKITVNHVLELLSVIHSIRVILPLQSPTPLSSRKETCVEAATRGQQKTDNYSPVQQNSATICSDHLFLIWASKLDIDCEFALVSGSSRFCAYKPCLCEKTRSYGHMVIFCRMCQWNWNIWWNKKTNK